MGVGQSDVHKLGVSALYAQSMCVSASESLTPRRSKMSRKGPPTLYPGPCVSREGWSSELNSSTCQTQCSTLDPLYPSLLGVRTATAPLDR